MNTEEVARWDYAERILGEVPSHRLVKRFNEIYFSSTHVLKIPLVEDAFPHRGFFEFEYLSEWVPEVQPSLHDMNATGSRSLMMRRLPSSDQVASVISTCKCSQATLHLMNCIEQVDDLRTPLKQAPWGLVLDDLQANLRRQSRPGNYPSGLSTSVIEISRTARELIDRARARSHGAEQDQVSIDLHGNLFSTNLWLIGDRSVALDPTRRNCIPYEYRYVGILIDMLFMHPKGLGVDSVRKAFAGRETNVRFPELGPVVLVIKFLVRLSFAQAEIGMQDGGNHDRSFDRLILRRGAEVLEIVRNIASSCTAL